MSVMFSFLFLIENIGFYEKNVKMKYMLLIWLCSFASGQNCLGPKEYPTMYNSWYECTRDAHKESQKLLAKAGYKYVNENKIATKYTCVPVRTY